MKRWVGVAGLIFVGIAGWRIGGALSSDALSMAVGILFGVMAGVPTALLVMASGRRREANEVQAERRRERVLQSYPPAAYMPQQPPVIVLAGPQGFASGGQDVGYRSPTNGMGRMESLWPPDAPQARRFKVVGEQEAWLDEW